MIESKYVYLDIHEVDNILDGQLVFVYIEPEGNNSDYITIQSEFLKVKYKVDQNKYEVVWNMK